MQPKYDINTITQLIPQRAPMLEVDSFYGMEDEVALAGLTLREDNLFVEGGHFCAEGMVEHMAQSAAARAGYVAMEKGEPVKLGYIGAVQKAEFKRLPKVGEQIITRVKIVDEVMNITLVEIVSEVGEEQVASCRMKIFIEQ